ncbi:MAG: acetate--CoA ligase [Candidatus Woesearchaeota archaeon]
MVKKVIKKGKIFWPGKEIKERAWVNNKNIYKIADKNPVKFWENLAKEGITWNKEWKKTYEEKPPYFKWFVGGKLNVSVNCLDRHLKNRKDNTALVFVPEPTKEKTVKYTYQELYDKVNKLANLLKKLKVKKGDVVAIYLPLIPEVIISMLACARIGAIHSVVFSAFSADALQTRLKDGKANVLITADGYYRRGEALDLLSKAKEGLKGTKVKKVVVVPRLGKKIRGKKFVSWKEVEKQNPYCEPVYVESNDPLFILYSSGTTGVPKGILHDSGGYITQAYWTCRYVFDMHENDIHWCTADIGWVTGHTYACYGPLANGITTLIYEGTPDYPDFSRWWNIVDKNKVSIFYTAPTAIRMFMKAGNKWFKKYKLKSLRLLGSVGEPIDVDAWMWYFNKVGKGNCPVVDTWWQTETGGTLIMSLPGIGPFIPTVSGRSFPGTRHMIVDDNGRKVKAGKAGNLVQVSPFAPGMLHDIYNNSKRYRKTYWSRFKGKYDTSDGAFMDKNGYIRIVGRVDDVMKVAGHRMSTAEIENAINGYPDVNESAIVPMADKLRGQVPVAFVILKRGSPSDELVKKIKKQVDSKIGPIARPAKIYFVDDLPKTRSGKIMRRILKALLAKEEPKGLMTLVNPETVEKIKEIIG